MAILKQLDAVAQTVLPPNKYHMIYFGSETYLDAEAELKSLMNELGTVVDEPKNLLLPAFEYMDLFCCMSPALPEQAMMVCVVDKEDVQIQKETIGWPLAS